MKRYENPLIFPLGKNKISNYIAALLTLGACVYLVVSSPEFFFSKQWFEAVCFWLLLLLLLALGFMMPLAKVDLTDNTVVISSLGVKLCRVPKDQIGLFCTGIRHTQHRHDKYIGICYGSLEDFAALREQQLLRNPVSRDEVALRQCDPNWQENFMKQYLAKRLQRRFFIHIRRHVIWIEHTQQRELILKGIFPDAPWKELAFEDSWR